LRREVETRLKSFGSREFNQDVSRAKRVAATEAVFVTDRGRPTHVLLSIDAYRQLLGRSDTLADLLAADDPIRVEPDWRSAGPWSRRS
jgi:prevent-host-death family protein